MKLLLFNPETEYALASGASFYTPPSRIDSMRRERQLLPEAWADPGDAILIDDDAVLTSDCRLVRWKDVGSFFTENPGAIVQPWGWNHALRKRLLLAGAPLSALPEEPFIDLVRNLAHRRTTSLLTEEWNLRTGMQVDVPTELFSEEECLEFLRSHPGCWMKAPWSSSGRGVINTAADMTEVLVGQWCRGIIRRQGSVIAETGADKMADFATEWKMEGEDLQYLGLSCFQTSRRGKYIANENLPQRDLACRFDAISSIPISRVVEIQKDVLKSVLAGYQGRLGVDMIVEADGALRPFTEVNLRRTMGMLSIASN